jgi:hypothetical protein
MVTELDGTPLYLTDDIGMVWRPPTDARRGIAWKTCTRVRWARLDSLIVIVKGGQSCCLRGSHVSCCQVISLARWLLIQISVIPSDIGETCSLCPNVEVLFHYVHMIFMVMFNYDYLVVKNDDSKNGWLSYHVCLAQVGNLLLLINLTWPITCLKWLVVGASRLESVISLEAFACLEFVTFRSRQISLVERSHSSFCSCCFYLFVCKWGSSSFFRWRRWELSVEDPDWGLPQNSDYILKHLLGFIFCKL